MKITLEPTGTNTSGHPIVSIDSPGNDKDITQVFDDLVRPLLIAWGFAQQTVDEILNPEDI